MKYIPGGFLHPLGFNRQYWEYTSEENTILNGRHFARMAKLKPNSTELCEKKPLWELMGKSRLQWRIEHFFIKWLAIVGETVYNSIAKVKM